jgi:hypothetical protein
VSNRLRIFLFGVLLGAAPASPGLGGDTLPLLEVRLSSDQMVDAEPGTVLKASALVLNHSERSEDAEDYLGVPEGWEVPLQGSSQFRLDAGGRVVRLLVLHIPPTFPAGTYNITYSANFSNAPPAAYTVGFTVRVPRRIKLDAEIIDGDKTLIAGETWRGNLKLTNNGNCPVTGRVNARALPSGAARAVPDVTMLSPSASDTIALTLKTDDRLMQRTRYSIEISVGPEANWGVDTYARASASISVVPRVTGILDRYHRLPTEVQLVAAVEEKNTRFQIDACGSGTLDEAGNRRVGFLIRGPDIEDVGRYGRRDEYWFHYEDGRSRFTIGDRTYSLSSLTQRFTYGRGVQAEFALSNLEIGGLHVTNRDLTPKQTCAGAYVAFRPHRVFEVRGNFLAKTADSTFCEGCNRSRVYSVETRLSPGKEFELEAEYGFSRYDAPAGVEDKAYRVESRGKFLNRFDYALEAVHAGPDYGGWYRGSDQTNGSITARVSRTLRGRLLYNFQENTPRDTTDTSTADRVRNLRCGMSYLSAGGLQATADYGHFERNDRLLPADHDFIERTAILGLGRASRRFSIHGQAELGRLEDRLRGPGWRPLQRYGLSAILRAGKEQTFIVNARTGDARFTDAPERERAYGLSWRTRFGGRARLNVDFTMNRKVDRPAQWHRGLISNLCIDLPNGHLLSIRGHIFGKADVGDREWALFLAYGIPARIPTARLKSTGSLKGKVYDAELAGNPPLEGVVLFTGGEYAVSNEDGEFMFPAIEPGEHLLQIEQESLGIGKTTGAKSPLRVEVDGGKTAELEISVVSACGITGEARLFASKDGQPAPFQYGIRECLGVSPADSVNSHNAPNLIDVGGIQVIVEITNGIETMRQASDSRGRFSFQQIRPGAWKIRLFARDLPELYRLESDELDIRLEPGEERHVVARALPKIRPIQMIDGGRVRLASDPSD